MSFFSVFTQRDRQTDWHTVSDKQTHTKRRTTRRASFARQVIKLTYKANLTGVSIHLACLLNSPAAAVLVHPSVRR